METWSPFRHDGFCKMIESCPFPAVFFQVPSSIFLGNTCSFWQWKCTLPGKAWMSVQANRVHLLKTWYFTKQILQYQGLSRYFDQTNGIFSTEHIVAHFPPHKKKQQNDVTWGIPRFAAAWNTKPTEHLVQRKSFEWMNHLQLVTDWFLTWKPTHWVSHTSKETSQTKSSDFQSSVMVSSLRPSAALSGNDPLNP